MAKTTGLLLMALSNCNRRLQLVRSITVNINRRKMVVKCLLLLVLLLSKKKLSSIGVNRSCRRLPRNTGWFEKAWSSYSDKKFKKTFRVSKETFSFILSKIRYKLEREYIVEEPISPECRLALCLYRLGRGDYLFTLSEMSGLGVSTISGIIVEVCDAIVSCLWKEQVDNYYPKDSTTFKSKVLDMEQIWQFPYSWAAIDGCHIPIKCPPGGARACKEFHNFKNFYSIVLMGMVDAKYRFVWASCGYPGNNHDSMIFKSSSAYKGLTSCANGSIIFKEGNLNIRPLVLGDSAFAMENWLIKPYSNAVLSPAERYFNYRLSRARMVVEAGFGQLKGRWRYLMKKCEGGLDGLKLAVLACIVLHNLCINLGDKTTPCMDLTLDPLTSERRDRTVIEDLLLMQATTVKDKPTHSGQRIRAELKEKLWREKATGLI